jgi:hypothetical protein
MMVNAPKVKVDIAIYRDQLPFSIRRSAESERACGVGYLIRKSEQQSA